MQSISKFFGACVYLPRALCIPLTQTGACFYLLPPSFNPNNSLTMEKLMDKKDMAEALGVTVKTIDKWVSEKRIPYIRITGKCVRFIWSEVHAYFVKKEIQPEDLKTAMNQPQPRRRKRKIK